MNRIALALLALTLASCAALYGVIRYSRGLPRTIGNGTFEFTIERAQTGLDHKDFHFMGSLKNVGSTEAVFDSGEVEARDEGSGVSYFSVSRDSQTVTLPLDMQHVILKRTLKPGQKITGTLWFPTARGEARARTDRLVQGACYDRQAHQDDAAYYAAAAESCQASATFWSGNSARKPNIWVSMA